MSSDSKVPIQDAVRVLEVFAHSAQVPLDRVLAGRAVRLRFVMQDADLYALSFCQLN